MQYFHPLNVSLFIFHTPAGFMSVQVMKIMKINLGIIGLLDCKSVEVKASKVTKELFYSWTVTVILLKYC